MPTSQEDPWIRLYTPSVGNYIKSAMGNKLSTLEMFLDIEHFYYSSTFDKTTFKSIGLALQGHDVDSTLSRWVTGMLRYREVLFNVGGTESEVVVDSGCPREE